MVIEITDQDFEQKVIKSKLPVLIDMWRPGCVPCKALDPIIVKLADKYNGKCNFYRMNVTENQKTAQKYHVMSLPTLMFFKNGAVVNTLMGGTTERALTPKIEEVL